MAAFDLTVEPWIRVRLGSGEVTELSLTDVFERAHEIRALAGELPTQDVAVLRLLIAILRRTHSGAVGAGAWRALWDRQRLDPAPIAAYLAEHRDRFDLLHPETPFYQVADLRTAKDELTELSRLVADVPSGHQFFTTRAGSGLTSMSFAEAARWVVHCQAYDVSGIKSGALGDDRVKGGKGYPIGIAWCGWLGAIVVQGADLFHTMLLNCPLDPVPDEDRPVWERPPQTAATEGREWPTGPLDLLTWQSRRIRIGHDGSHATAVLIANGDALHPRNRFDEESMTSWRYSEPQTKALGTGVPAFMPRAHPQDRSIWRGLAGLLAEGQAGEDDRLLKPGRWQTWLAELRRADALARSIVLPLRAVGVHYGSNSSVIDDITDDVLDVPLEVLAVPEVRRLAVNGVRDADAVAQALGYFNIELAEAAGLTGDRAKDVAAAAREQAYANLERPYRDWLAGLTEDSTVDTARPAWQRVAYELAQTVSRDLVRRAGQASWIGREVSRGPDRTIYLDAALAELGLRRRLRKALPDAFLDDTALDDNPNGDAA